MARSFDVALLVGSLRKDSFSRKLAKALVALSPATLRCRIVELGDLPLYNEDLDNHAPASWQRFRSEVGTAHAVLFITPEYNRSIPGCLKNALDVGSRPEGKNLFDGLPAGVISITPYNLGAFGANHALRQTFVYLNLLVMQQPEAYVSKAAELFDAGGHLKDGETHDFLTKFMGAFSQWIARASGKGESTDGAQDFAEFLKRRSEAARAYVKGDAKPLDAITAHNGAASFFPPNGGSEQGAEAVLARYDKDVKAFGASGETSLEIIQSAAGGDVAFWTGFQSASVTFGGSRQPVTMKLRVTEAFRRVGGEWQLVHRHADPHAEPVAAKQEPAANRQREAG